MAYPSLGLTPAVTLAFWGDWDISVSQLAARQVTSFCWDLSWAWPTLARCSPWPSTQSSGDGTPLPLPSVLGHRAVPWLCVLGALLAAAAEKA